MTAELWLLHSLIGLGLAVGVLIAVGWAADHRITTTNRHRKTREGTTDGSARIHRAEEEGGA
ncbi:hypothetical protein ABZX72_29365 [Streptomyces cyaneofuscatus]|uniref:hypothetical protein n=1 Tax=Streptomyces cyaneofuscatus TaxID=66883 RepID=UPI0033A718F7